jgi:predicted signal transduction protein with EAL and GGDEF domain
LHKYDFDYLKIDKSFIDDIVANGGKKKIVAALARLGKDFGMTVIAEGIESKEAADTAKAIGCRMGQGYHLGAPEVLNDAGAAELQPKSAGPDAGSDVAQHAADAEVIILDKSLEAPPAGRPVRRRLFSMSRR